MELRRWLQLLALALLCPWSATGEIAELRTKLRAGAPMTMVDLIKEQTYRHHTGRETAAVYPALDSKHHNNSGTQQKHLKLVPAQAPTKTRAVAPRATQGTLIAWGPQSGGTKKAPAPVGAVEYEVFTVDGDPIIVPQDKSQISLTNAWAVPAAVVALLLLAASIGLLVIYRRRRASRYHGLHEAELGQVHRNI